MVDHKSIRLDAVLGALSDSTRRSIVERLAAEPMTVGRLAEPFAMSLQGVSKHVMVLERAGIARRERRGREQVVTLRPDALKGVDDWLAFYRRFWTDKLDRLAAYVEADATEKDTPAPRGRRSRHADSISRTHGKQQDENSTGKRRRR